jgi:predicted transcriptional regulator
MSNRVQALVDRVKAIGMPQKLLAADAGLDQDTITRTLRGHTDPLSSTLDKIETAVAAREIGMLDHLLPLHAEARLERIAELLRHRGFRVEKDAA